MEWGGRCDTALHGILVEKVYGSVGIELVLVLNFIDLNHTVTEKPFLCSNERVLDLFLFI